MITVIILSLILSIQCTNLDHKFIRDDKTGVCGSYDVRDATESDVFKVTSDSVICISSSDFLIEDGVIDIEISVISKSLPDHLSIIIYNVTNNGADKEVGRQNVISSQINYGESQTFKIDVTSQLSYGYVVIIGRAPENSLINVKSIRFTSSKSFEHFGDQINSMSKSFMENMVIEPITDSLDDDVTNPIVTIPFPTVFPSNTDSTNPIVTIPFPTVFPSNTSSTDPIVTVPFPTVFPSGTDSTDPIVTVPVPTVFPSGTDSTDPIVTIPVPTVFPSGTDSTDPIVTIPVPTVIEGISTTAAPDIIAVAGLSTGAIIGIVVGSIFGVALIACGVWLIVKNSKTQTVKVVPY